MSGHGNEEILAILAQTIGLAQQARDRVEALDAPAVERRQVAWPIGSAIEHLRAAQRRLPPDR